MLTKLIRDNWLKGIPKVSETLERTNRKDLEEKTGKLLDIFRFKYDTTVK